MNTITVLSQETIDKIAAGEVVERPASIVKELVENAVDAGANAVTVEIKDGGMSFIRVTDNGCGIPSPEVPVAFLRHATSKIRTVEDLQTSGTLGFRGEALSSIAAIAQVELITKTAGSLTGIRYLIEGGIEKGNEEIGAPEGTTFLIRSMFYNTPARRKFLKSAQTEAGYVSDLMERLALSHPGISFKFMNQGQTKLHTSGNGRLKDIVYGIFGREITANLLPVEADCGSFRLSGLIGKPTVSRGNRNYENYFVNGRYVRSQVIARAIEEAYKPFLMNHRYPFTVLSLVMDGDRLDANVHPTKMEVRFSDQAEVYERILQTLRDTLAGRELIPEISLEHRPETRKQTETDRGKTDSPEPFETVRRRMLQAADRVAEDGPSYGAGRASNQPDCQTFGQPNLRGSRAQTDAAAGLPDRRTQEASARAAAEQPDGRTKEVSARAAAEQSAGQIQEPSAASGGMLPGQRIDASLRPITGNLPAEKSVQAHARVADSQAAVKSAQTEEAGRPAEAEAGQEKAKDRDRKAADSPAVPEAETGSRQAPVQMELFEDRLLSRENVREHRLIGQVFDTYWMVEFRDKLYIIDQHAAHEKVLYERFLRQFAEKQQTSQMISPPLILSLTMAEELVLQKYMEHFRAVGYEIEPFGGREYSIRAVPGNLYGLADQELFLEMLDGLADISEQAAAERINEKIAMMSCKAAVKGNRTISAQEADALIGELLKLENPYHCPHGRPTIISMTKYELEKKFKRIV